MLKHMVKQPGFNESVSIISDHITDFESQVLSVLKNESSPTATQVFRACSSYDSSFLKAANGIFRIRGWPHLYKDCVSDFVGTVFYKDVKPRHSINAVFNAIISRAKLLDSESEYFVKNILEKWEPREKLLANWDNPTTNYNYPWERSNKFCTLNVVGFVRVGSTWYNDLTLTNARLLSALPLFKRQYLQEYIYVDPQGENTHAVKEILPKYVSDDVHGPRIRNTTTILYRLRGDAKPASFYSIYPEDNPALISAMDDIELFVQQATDAVTPSNIAILFLPVALNLIPISLISRVSDWKMLLYMLMSDILTVIPLAIKGIELIVIARQRHKSVAVRMLSSVNGTLGESAAAELWGAECRAKDNVLPSGIVFLTLALIFMIAGVAAEFWARAYVERRVQSREELKSLFLRIGDEEHYDGDSYVSSLQLNTYRNKVGGVEDE